MLKSLLLLASAVAQEDILDESRRQSFRLDPTDTILVMGAVLTLVLLLFFWALYIRKRPESKHGARRIVGTGVPRPSEHHGTRRRVRKRRRRHGDHYPRNPTLGETGGLPPVREEPSDPAPEGSGDAAPESPRSST